MDDNKTKAKKMYFDYACRTFFMAHDGVLEEYEDFGISETDETEWRREYIALWVQQLDVDDLTAVDRLRDAEAGEALPDLIKMAGKGDGYARLWYANAIWHLANRASISNTVREKALQTALELWRSLVQGVSDLSDAHKARILPHMGALEAASPEEYVLNCANGKLAEAKKQGL